MNIEHQCCTDLASWFQPVRGPLDYGIFEHQAGTVYFPERRREVSAALFCVSRLKQQANTVCREGRTNYIDNETS